VFGWMIFGKEWTPEERKRAVAMLVLFVASALFWASFEQAGSSLNLFADRATNRYIGHWQVPASWFQSVQPVFVISLAPVFAWLWMALGRRRLEPPSPAKFAFGLLFAGLAFAILVPASKMTEGGAQVTMWWLITTYLLHTLGELSLSPVGLSTMSKLAPDRAGGFTMGIWFLSTAIGNSLAGKAGGMYSSMSLPMLFGVVAGSTIVAAVILALLIKPTVRFMSGVK